MGIPKLLLAAAALSCALCSPAYAHKAADAFIAVDARAEPVSAIVEISAADLKALDPGANGPADNIPKALLGFPMSAGGKPCPWQNFAAPEPFFKGSALYLRLRAQADCPGASQGAPVTLEDRLDIQSSAGRQSFYSLKTQAKTYAGAFSSASPSQTFASGASPAAGTAKTFFELGVEHILDGTDHIAFLISLLLGCSCAFIGKHKIASPDARKSAADALKIITAFTASHSVTLALSALGFVALPERFTETAIAASVFCAAANNLFPVVRSRLWVWAFAFGLVHGFGFAGALAQTPLPSGFEALALGCFNAGVEAGQIAIAAVAFPLIMLARHKPLYRLAAEPAASALIAMAGLLWIAQRAFA